MPVISKIRFTNVIYEGGSKRYNDELFLFDGHNAAILLENGGGKTVFIQTALQAILPHTDMAGRKIRETLSLSGTPAHIAIEWITSDSPRRYALTAVTLFLHNNDLESYRYVHEYEEGHPHAIEHLPFAKEGLNGKKRPADKGEMQEYYSSMSSRYMNARTFSTIKEYHAYLESQFQIVPSEWRNIAVINGAEGGVELFFDNCKTTDQLVSQLLIPTVEEAMNGNGADAFAEIFEKQREQFKQSKQLRAQIQESRLLEGEIQRVRQVYAAYEEARKRLEREKEWAKALFAHARNEQAKTTEELQKTARQLEGAEAELLAIKRRKAAREIAVQENVLHACILEWQQEKGQYEEKEREASELEHQQLTLEYARYKAKRQEALEQKELAESQLRGLDEKQDIAQTTADRDRIKREIRGYYADVEQALKRDETYLNSQLEVLQAKREKHTAEVEYARGQIEAGKQAQAAARSRMEQTARQVERIADKILDNPLQETVEASIPVWQDEMEKTLANQKLYQQHILECERNREMLAEKLEQARQEMQTALEERNRWQMKCQEVERQQESLLADVKLHLPRLGYLDSLYTRQETVKQMLGDKLALLEREKEDAMRQERIATRQSDDYQDSPVFLADPQLAVLAARWKDDFHYLETGTRFIQEMAQEREISLDILYARFPYWSALLVTTEQELDKLVQRVAKYAAQLVNPVFVASLQEVRNWLDSPEEYESRCREIVPSHWRENLDPERFESWKQEVRQKAEDAMGLRKSKEREYQQWLQLCDQVNRFYAQYPLEAYRDWLRQRDERQEHADDLQREIAQLTELVRKYERERELYREKLAEETGREQHLGYRLREAKEYMQLKKEWEEAKKAEEQLAGELQAQQQAFAALRKALAALEEQIEERRSELAEKRDERTRLFGDWLFQQVQSLSPLPPRYSLERLRAELEVLEGLLREQQASRAELERQISRCRGQIEDCESGMKLVLAKASQPLDEEAPFPVDGAAQLQRLVEKGARLKRELAALRERVEQRNNMAVGQGARLEEMKKNFAEQFPGEEIDLFTGNLEDAKRELEQEEQRVSSRKDYLLEQERQGQEAARQLNEVIHLLEIRNASHLFLHQQVQEVPLPEDDLLAFSYQRMKIAQKRLRELEARQADADREWKKVASEKERFTRFCDEAIEHRKLRETAKAGIASKQTFAEVEEWAANMSRTIAAGVRVLEDQLQGRDKELQDFITIVHTHLQRIAIELKLIPKKTSVKVENGRKEIYNFHVPEWQEEVGKQQLRSHIDWMLQRLDGEEFKDQDGKDDLGKIRKFIYSSLQSRSLLGIVMGHDSIRVKCRKVSKDGKVSGALASWEESNKWSGGEKWSKNMTLFLGLLNYLVEKRQAIPQNGKRNRTVIVDNPFGKASSEHVLDPVFFIADELGFQLIALTAHAEGKFIRDYFPIVYSCRLRESANGDALIMTKEREIRQAYFRDHDPMAFVRLSEHEQLSLF